MADKPSRSLVVFGDGLARFIDPSQHAHLHSLASISSCGFLSLPNSPPSGSLPSSLSFHFHFSTTLPLFCCCIRIHLIMCSFQKARMRGLLENSPCFWMHRKL